MRFLCSCNNKFLTEDDLGSVLDENETVIVAQKKTVESHIDHQDQDKIINTNINETLIQNKDQTTAGQISSIKIATLKEIEMEAIKSSVERNKWNMTTTAEELGISRMTLYRKLEQYGLRGKEQ